MKNCLISPNTMDDKQQTQAFADDLDRLVERYRQEFNMTYASVVGVMQMKAFLLCYESQERVDEI